MQQLYILKQIHQNLLSIKSYTTSSFIKFFKSIDKQSSKLAESFNKQIISRINRKVRKYRKCLTILFTILCILGFISGLVMATFKYADFQQQGVVVNRTEQQMYNDMYNNTWVYTGMAGKMVTVPKVKFILEYNNQKYKQLRQKQQQQDIYHIIYPSISTRVKQGTKLHINTIVQCQIITSNLKQFFIQYGYSQNNNKQNLPLWTSYMSQKSHNIISNIIKSFNFYTLSNKLLISTINKQFSKMTSEFKLKILSLEILYSDDKMMKRQTIGTQLLQAKSMLSQVTKQYDKVDDYVIINNNNTKNMYIKNSLTQSSINSNLLTLSTNTLTTFLSSVSLITSSFSNLSNNITDNSIKTQKFLWIYFNNLYNQTYKYDRMKKIINSNSNSYGYVNSNSNSENSYENSDMLYEKMKYQTLMSGNVMGYNTGKKNW